MDYGMTLIDASNGEQMFHEGAGSDTGRGMMADIGAGGYYQFWSSGNNARISEGGTDFEETYLPNASYTTYNFRIFWDGDLYDELLDGTATSSRNGEMTIYNCNGAMMIPLFSTSGCYSNNTTKNNPALTADLFGDWREELVCRLTDSSALRVYTTNIYTDYKMKSLMYDAVYRCGVAAEQTAYNQPPHLGYYLTEKSDNSLENAPEITALAGATQVLVTDFDDLDVGSLFTYGTYPYTDADDSDNDTDAIIEGLTLSIPCASDKTSSSKVMGVINTGNDDHALIMGSGQYASALRGPIVYLTNSAAVEDDDTYGLLTFALKLYDGIDGFTGSLYFLSDTTANTKSTDYANKIATITTEDIGVGEWATVEYKYTSTTYELYVNGSKLSSGSCTLADTPILAINTSSSSTNPYTNAVIDNMYVYTVDVNATPAPDSSSTTIVESVYSNDCSSTDNWEGANSTIAVTDGSVSLSGSGSGDRSAMFTYPTSVSSITSGKIKATFDFYFSDNYGEEDKSNAQIALLDTASTQKSNANAVTSSNIMWALQSTTWSSTRNDTYYTSDDTGSTFTVTKATWYTVTADIDFDASTMDVVVTEKDSDTVLCSSSDVSITDGNGLQYLYVVSPRYQNGTRATYIDNIEVYTVEEATPTPTPTVEPTAAPTATPTTAPTATPEATAAPEETTAPTADATTA
ncbi:MAG: hypothetical protein LIO59_01120, partial [Oscillospiraceae bacterium]|nr:hypothetical protein [Oscillospiraceae bacterium]